MRIHLVVAFYVLLAGFVTGISIAEWAVILLALGLVPALELINTALERLSDQVSQDFAKNIERCKDCAAGAVLWCAIFSAALGALIFFSQGRPARALQFALTHPVAAVCIVLTLPPLLYFVFRRS